jgi:hypothetical protein
MKYTLKVLLVFVENVSLIGFVALEKIRTFATKEKKLYYIISCE